MKVAVLYRFGSEQERKVTDFEREYQQRTGRSFDKINTDTPEGAEKARVYDVTSYPAVLALSDDGVLQQMWQGEDMPLINEVSYYNSPFNNS